MNIHREQHRPGDAPTSTKGSGSAAEQPQPSPSSASQAKTSPSLGAMPARCTRLPFTLLKLDPSQPVSVINANPVFDTKDAATVVGVSEDCLRKWRLRNQGPSYLQYGEDGAVRYFLSELIAFRLRHQVTPSKPLKGWSK